MNWITNCIGKSLVVLAIHTTNIVDWSSQKVTPIEGSKYMVHVEYTKTNEFRVVTLGVMDGTNSMPCIKILWKDGNPLGVTADE